MSFFSSLFRGVSDRTPYRPLYDRVIAVARDPAWYRDGGVPDTLDGRFDMVAAVLALVLLRLEREGDRTADASVRIAEIFIDDMEGSVWQIGIGDLLVGKHVGRMTGALGGRLGAFRSTSAEGAGFNPVVRRNIFHDAPPSDEALRLVSGRLERLHEGLVAMEVERILDGELPPL